jgi:hypothetical protein
MASEPGPGGSATTTIRARSQGPSSRRAGQIAPAPSAGRSVGPRAYRGYEDHGHLRQERRCRGRANVMAGHGSGSRDRPRSWPGAGSHMAADQHVHRRQEGSGQGSGGSRERRVDHDRLRPWYKAVTRRGRPSRPGWPHRCQRLPNLRSRTFRCNCRALRPYQPFGCRPDGQADGPGLAPDRRYARVSYASGGGGASRVPRIAGDVTAGSALVSCVLVSYAAGAERRRF